MSLDIPLPKIAEATSESSIQNAEIEKLQVLTSTSSNIENYDEALKFIKRKQLHDKEGQFSSVLQNGEGLSDDDRIALKKLIRRIDLRIVTLLTIVYLLNYLELALLNYAGIMGILDELKNSNQFADLGTVTFCCYIIGEPCAAYLFQKYPPAKVFTFFILCWGIVVTLHLTCHNFASYMVVRALLGFFESCVVPGCVTITGMWYTKDQQSTRIGIWTSSAGTGNIVGGLLSFAFQHTHSKNHFLYSYKIFFMVIGLLTVLFAVILFFYLPDNPTTAKFLTDHEKWLILENIRENQTGTENKTFKKSQLYEMLFHDKHTWPMFFLTLMTMCAVGGLGVFGTTITASFGYSNEVTTLLQLSLGGCIALTLLVSLGLCGKYGQRSLISVALLIVGIAGLIMLLSCKNKVALLIGLYMVYSGTCIIAMIYGWNSANTAGHTKRIYRNGLTMIGYAIGCIIGPQFFRDKDAPHYWPAKIVLLVFYCVSVPLVLLVAYISYSENKRKESLGDVEMPENFEFLDLTDIENPKFKYSY